LLDRPEDVGLDVQFLLEAFFFLSGFRGAGGFGANPLAYADVVDFAVRVGYSEPSELFFFMDAMSALDKAYLANQKPAAKE
jgi:hypothetical protein